MVFYRYFSDSDEESEKKPFNTVPGSFKEGVYTAPKAGAYLVSASVFIGNGNDDGVGIAPTGTRIEVRKNAEKDGSLLDAKSSPSPDEHTVTASGSTVLNLDIGDRVSIWVNCRGGEKLFVDSGRVATWLSIAMLNDYENPAE